MSYTIAIQNTLDESHTIPTTEQFEKWAQTALSNQIESAEVCLRIVDDEESEQLNSRYRQKQSPTNVLSFPCEIPEGIELETLYLGDLVLCSQVIEREAIDQHKTLDAHWAHMVIHGLLHLLGYDHIEPQQADVMEALEAKLLKQLGYDNPYGDDQQ